MDHPSMTNNNSQTTNDLDKLFSFASSLTERQAAIEQKLRSHGITTIEQLANLEVQGLCIIGISFVDADALIKQARYCFLNFIKIS